MSDESTKKKLRKEPNTSLESDGTKQNSQKSRPSREAFIKQREIEEAALKKINYGDIITDAPLDGSDIFESPGALRGTSKLILD